MLSFMKGTSGFRIDLVALEVALEESSAASALASWRAMRVRQFELYLVEFRE